MGSLLRLGTRGSDLALAQTKLVADLLMSKHPRLQVVTVPIRTSGDTLPPAGWGERDAKSAFTGEIESELREGKIDAAVHSMKDLPAAMDPRLVVGATPSRGDPRDALVSRAGVPLSAMPAGSTIGTSSVRRRAQLLAARPELKLVEVHGNVGTRVRKLSERGLDGLVLAAAGLERAGLGPAITQRFEVEEMTPAVCQGILAVQARRDDPSTIDLLASIDDPTTHAAATCERAFAAALGGDCNVPIGAFAATDSGLIAALGMVARPDGSRIARAKAQGQFSDAESIGRRLAAGAEEAGGAEILQELRA